MNFLEAVEIASRDNVSMRRSTWVDGVVMFIAKPNGKDDSRYQYSHQSLGAPYVATCHVAACELLGVRCLTDILATDWELRYP